MAQSPRITILGNFSGRNAGDNAICHSVMSEITAACGPDVEFEIPTIQPQYVRSFFGPRFKVKPVGLLPWNGTVRMLGIPPLLSCTRTDLSVVTDAILFDAQLWNPIFSYLLGISCAARAMQFAGKPLMLYNTSAGPITRPMGGAFLRYVSSFARVRCLRDTPSEKLMRETFQLTENTYLTADSALNTQPCDDDRARSILRSTGLYGQRPVIALNINTYIDRYYKDLYKRGDAYLDRNTFLDDVASTADWIVETLKADVLIALTQHMDVTIGNELYQRIRHQEHTGMISNRDYHHGELAGVFRHVDGMVAMRTHALILAASVHTPVFGIVSYPKTLGFMSSIGQEQHTISVADFSAQTFKENLQRFWDERDQIRNDMIPRVEESKKRAAWSATHVKRLLGV